MQRGAITSTRYRMRYHLFFLILPRIGHNATHYHTFSLSLAWYVGYLQRVTTRYQHLF